MRRLLIGAVLALLAFSGPVFAQGAIGQAGPITPGHSLIAVQNGLAMDGGAALGGPINTGLSELLVQSRGNGQAPTTANGFLQGPFQNSGTGQFGSHECQYAGSPKSPAGSYYLCMDPDTVANGTPSGVISFGSIGAAPLLPLQFCVNLSCFQFPFAGTGSGNVISGGTTIINDPACFTNTIGTGIGPCPGGGGGSAGPFQVNTSNVSGTPGFTSFLNLPNAASFSTSPTGNPTTGSLLATLSTVAVQANTTSTTNREFLGNFGLTSGTGASSTGQNGDKVALYSGAVGNPGTGPLWAANFLTSQTSGSGSYNAQTLELDLNNFNTSRAGADGPTGLPTFVANGLSISGISDSNAFQNTSGLAIDSFGGPAGNQALWAHGITLTGTYGFNEFADYGISNVGFEMFGSHAYGFDCSQGTFSIGCFRIGSNSGSGLLGRNAANTADAQLLTFTGTNELLCQTNCGQVSSAAPVLAPSFAAATGMTIASLPVPTGSGTAEQCALWTTPGNLGSTGCAASTADTVTIINNSGTISAVSVGLPPISATASTTSTTLTPGQSGIIDVSLTSNTAFTISAPSPSSDGRLLKLVLTQDGTGSRLVTFTNVLFGTTVSGFTASTAANTSDYVGLQWSATAGKWVMLAFALGYTL
jgi:hypothetical protein